MARLCRLVLLCMASRTASVHGSGEHMTEGQCATPNGACKAHGGSLLQVKQSTRANMTVEQDASIESGMTCRKHCAVDTCACPTECTEDAREACEAKGCKWCEEVVRCDLYAAGVTNTNACPEDL